MGKAETKKTAKKTDTKKLVGVALFTAIVVVLQLVGGSIKVGIFSISLVLVPIVIGAALYGTKAGAWLGFVFGLAVLLSGDAAAFLAVNVVGAIIVCLAKGILAGLCAGLVYKAIEKKNGTIAVIASAVTCPVVNTGVFLLGCVIFFMETISGWAETFGFGSNVAAYMIFGMVGVNFLIELVVNIVLAPVIVQLIKIGRKSKIG